MVAHCLSTMSYLECPRPLHTHTHSLPTTNNPIQHLPFFFFVALSLIRKPAQCQSKGVTRTTLCFESCDHKIYALTTLVREQRMVSGWVSHSSTCVQMLVLACNLDIVRWANNTLSRIHQEFLRDKRCSRDFNGKYT